MYNKEETLEYVHLFCAEDDLGVLPPEAEPLYDVDTDSWDLWFKVDDDDSVAIPLQTEEECNSVIKAIKDQRDSFRKSLTPNKENE
ncbi:MAG: hypothetical protein CL885_00895 [Dehalococcoidia bacterium]|nr:hypothetical protein [Dehalococcoidia bacterium]|tara:strand:- start:546 stop:803 length:258 start_codon:yes stop_codon:yes gene_type:complete